MLLASLTVLLRGCPVEPSTLAEGHTELNFRFGGGKGSAGRGGQEVEPVTGQDKWLQVPNHL